MQDKCELPQMPLWLGRFNMGEFEKAMTIPVMEN